MVKLGMQTKSTPIIIEHQENITWFRLNNPSRLNALNSQMIQIMTDGINAVSYTHLTLPTKRIV